MNLIKLIVGNGNQKDAKSSCCSVEYVAVQDKAEAVKELTVDACCVPNNTTTCCE